MRIAIGSDHRGIELVARLEAWLTAEGHDVLPLGVCTGDSCDYPEPAWAVGQAVAAGDADRGVLICGSGIGVSIAANKVDGVRAALVHDSEAAAMTRRHNDANVVCLSAERTSPQAAIGIVHAFLVTEFEGGRHARRVAKIAAIEAGTDPVTVTAAD
jgi:ribose 5-phosphate isomerase B